MLTLAHLNTTPVRPNIVGIDCDQLAVGSKYTIGNAELIEIVSEAAFCSMPTIRVVLDRTTHLGTGKSLSHLVLVSKDFESLGANIIGIGRISGGSGISLFIAV